MRRRLGLALTVLSLLLGAPCAGAQEPAPRPTIEQITRNLDALFRSRATIGRLEVTIVTPRQTRTMRMRMWARGEDRALIVIESPAREAGTATLRRDRNLWNYLPRVSRTIRVPPSMMLSSWMGSDLTNDDLTQSSTFRDGFTGRVVGPAPGGRGWLVRYEANAGTVGLWRRIDYVVNAGGDLPIEARSYDRRDRLARTIRFEDVRDVGGRRVPSRMVIVPEDQEGRRTELRYLEMEWDASVPESTFSLTQLERNR